MVDSGAHYSPTDIEARILAALRGAGLDPGRRLTPEQLAPLDHFHTGGLRASRELMQLAQIGAGDRVLDIGAGLAGPARMLVAEAGCRVGCVELSPDYCAGAEPVMHFPLPWATEPADNFLVRADEMRTVLGECGFAAKVFEDTSEEHLGRTVANATPAAPGQLGLSVFVDNLGQKASNARSSLEEGQVRLVRGVFRRQAGQFGGGAPGAGSSIG